jgi:hypothetical protein
VDFWAESTVHVANSQGIVYLQWFEGRKTGLFFFIEKKKDAGFFSDSARQNPLIFIQTTICTLRISVETGTCSTLITTTGEYHTDYIRRKCDGIAA